MSDLPKHLLGLLMGGLLLLMIRPAGAEDLYVLNSAGAIDTLSDWRSFRVTEYDIVPATEDRLLMRHRVSPPVPLSAIASQGLLIPLDEIAYMLPTFGIYVTGDGRRILGRPINLSSLLRQHRHIDVERQRLYLADEDASPLITRPQPRYVFLEIEVEIPRAPAPGGPALRRTVFVPITRAGAVVFHPDYITDARRELSIMTLSQSVGEPVEGEVWELTQPVDLFHRPGGDPIANLLPGTRITVIMGDSSWYRVSLEGWLPAGDWVTAKTADPVPAAEAESGSAP